MGDTAASIASIAFDFVGTSPAEIRAVAAVQVQPNEEKILNARERLAVKAEEERQASEDAKRPKHAARQLLSPERVQRRDGDARERYADPSGEYVGQFKKHLRSGYGILTYVTGDTYDGQWREDEPHGVGVRTWPDGARYEGQFYDGMRHGRGIFICGQGYQYRGEWQNQYRHGKGLQEYSGGEFYEGMFANGVFHGLGRYNFADGSVARGVFREGEFVEPGGGDSLRADAGSALSESKVVLNRSSQR
jgi:hypothetical protein